ncbi:hypothetical protein [Mycolicibacterium peregrinum]|uniref:hypothetical protein n=1 Tax=Mycolicibacterium peregrinum TaxID=43304 RepID=UPI003AAC9D00
MDISDMMITPAQSETDKNIAPPHDLDSDEQPPSLEPTNAIAVPPAVEMSAVERIQAFRSGTLKMPDIGGPSNTDDESEDSDIDGEAGHEEVHDDSGVESSAKSELSDLTDFPSSESKNAVKSLLTRRKALMLGIPVLVVAAGIAVPGLGGKKKDDTAEVANIPQSASVDGQQGGESQTSTSVAPDVLADGIIEPLAVTAAEYPISLTPAMDAFTPGKAWICAGQIGTVLTIELPALTAVSEISVVPGFDGRDKDGSSAWAKHRIVTSASFYLDYGDPIPAGPDGQGFTNSKEAQTTALHGAMTKTIRMVILGTESVAPDAPASSAAPKPGLLGDLGSLNLGSTPSPTSPADNAPATFALSSMKIVGHTAR